MAAPVANSKLRPTVAIRNNLDEGVNLGNQWRFIPAAILSIVAHGGLLVLFYFLIPTPPVAEKVVVREVANNPVEAPRQNKDEFMSPDIDPARLEPDSEINFDVDRIEKFSVPGKVENDAAIGIKDGDKSAPPTNLPAPGGFGGAGQGGALDLPGAVGTSMAVGEIGGYGTRGLPLPGTFYGRSGSTRERSLKDGGGTTESEAAVFKGLGWLARHQNKDGSWSLDGDFPDNYKSSDPTAATAFGLLPMLGAGKTHKDHDKNPYDKPIEKALMYLISKQNKKTGHLGGSMYSHSLATIALCEAYGLTQDPMLRKPAQMAIDYLVDAQHEAGGWRYGPRQPGDTSVSGWVIMALKSGQMSGLNVSPVAMRKAVSYIDDMCDRNSEGYGYVGPTGPRYTMTAVGLLCRQYLQAWGPQNPRMITAVENWLVKNTPTKTRNVYYYYYATQVLHHFGGQTWKKWNDETRDYLVKGQVAEGPQMGSWSPAGHAHCAGRLMVTSLNILTLEVYYRYLPLYQREAGSQMDSAVNKGI
jgi:hypothetical protein